MDVHIPRAVTIALRLRSIDVLTAQEAGAAELEDGRLLDRAAELGCVLVSQDKDPCVRVRAGRRIGVFFGHCLRTSTTSRRRKDGRGP